MAKYYFLTLVCYLALVQQLTAAPNRPRRSSFIQSCQENVSFTMKTTSGGSYKYTGPVGQGYCQPISPDVQTTITMNKPRSGCQYSIVPYSGGNCMDDARMNNTESFGKNSRQAVTLNRRKPVCSLKLQDMPFLGRCVTVKFLGGRVEPVVICNTNNDIGLRGRCYNLHGSSCENSYPTRVVSENTNIRMSLYSGVSCADESQLFHANDESEFLQGTQRLYEWTHENPRELVGSFQLVYQAERSGRK